MKKLIILPLLLLAVVVLADTIPTIILGDATAKSSFVAFTTAKKIYQITGYSASTQYIQVFETNTVPANGTVPKISVPVSAGQYYSIDFGYYGLNLDKCTLANSSTVNTLTIGAADTTFQVITLK